MLRPVVARRGNCAVQEGPAPLMGESSPELPIVPSGGSQTAPAAVGNLVPGPSAFCPFIDRDDTARESDSTYDPGRVKLKSYW